LLGENRHQIGGILSAARVDHLVRFNLGQDRSAASSAVSLGGHRMESPLGQPPLQGHLAAFKTDLVVAAGPRVLAFVAAPAGLAEPGPDATPDPLLRQAGCQAPA
jgi:hypothetical protein